MAESIYELQVVVALRDKISSSLKGISSTLAATEAQTKLMSKSMAAMGASNATLKEMQSRMDALAKANTFSKIANDMKQAGLEEHLATMDEGLNRVADAQKKMESFKKVAIGGGIAIGAGVAIGDMFSKAISSASQLQLAIQNVGQATHASTKQMQQLTNEAMTLGIKSSFSSVQTAGILNAMSGAGLPSNLLYNKNLASQYLQFADVVYNRTGAEPSDTAATAVTMSHTYGLYSNPKQLTSFLNNLNAILAHSHIDLSSFASQFAYFGQTAKNLGVSANQSLMMEAFANRMGVGGNSRSGGSSINDFLLRAVTPASAPALAAMKAAGLWNGNHSAFVNGKTGQFVGFPQAIQILQQFAKRYHGNAANEMGVLKTVFGVQGARMAMAMLNGNATSQYNLINKQVAQTSSVSKMHDAYMNTLKAQTNQLKTTLTDIGQSIGMTVLPSMIKFLQTVNKLTGALLHFSIAHPQIAKFLGMATMGASALLILGGAITTFVGLIGIAVSSWAAGGAARVGLSAMGKLAASPVTLPMKLYDKVAPSVGRGAWYAGQTVKNGAQWLGSASLSGIKSAGTTIASTTKSLASMATQATLAGTKMAVLAVRTGAVKVAQLAAAGASKLFRLAMIGVNLVLDANPIALIVLAIAGLVAGIIVMITHWKQTIQVVQQVWSWMKQLGTWISGAFMNIVHQAADWGKNIILGLWNGISGMAGWLTSRIGSFISNHITGPIKNLLGIHSPSRVAMEIGGYVSQGLALGITNNAHLVSHASNQLASNAIPTSVMSGGSAGSIGTQHIEININGYNKDKKELARFILDVVGKDARRSNMSTGLYPNKLAP